MIVVLLGLVGLDRMLARPEVVFLRDDGPARWIVPDDPVELRAQPAGERVVLYRIGFELEQVPADAVLEVVALTEATVYVAGQEVPVAGPARQDWSVPRRVPLSRWLQPGRSEIAIAVRNDAGPPALRARCDALGLATGPQWQSYRGQVWAPVRLARDRPLPAPSRGVESAARALASRAGVWALLFGAGIGLALLGRSSRLAWLGRPRHLQWALVAAWAVIGLNNFRQLPVDAGFDVSAHLDYIRFIVERGALPLADDGWQMFQMPLFYLVASVPWRILNAFLEPAQAALALRWIPLACGALQILVARRALAAVFPGREDLQIFGLVFAAALPVNLYMSQYVGNEPMAALFSAFALTLLLEMTREPERARSTRQQVLVAVALAAAILTKVTAVLLVPVAVAVLVRALGRRDAVPASGRLLLLLLLLAGWPFARNLVEYGTPFVFSSSSAEWWQAPGYRVAGDLWHFGRALDRPVFASLDGYWNALYSTMWTDGQMSSLIAVRWFPPWNLPFVLAGSWLALPVAAAMILGAARGLLRRDPAVVLATATILLYLAAVLQQFLALPIWSTAKASYTLGLLPLYAVLFATGLAPVVRTTAGRLLAAGLVAGWAGFALIGYFAT